MVVYPCDGLVFPTSYNPLGELKVEYLSLILANVLVDAPLVDDPSFSVLGRWR